jgi:hypothetical protein
VLLDSVLPATTTAVAPAAGGSGGSGSSTLHSVAIENIPLGFSTNGEHLVKVDLPVYG